MQLNGRFLVPAGFSREKSNKRAFMNCITDLEEVVNKV